MSAHDDGLYLHHIDQAVTKITRRLHDVTRAMFDDNDLLQDGIIRQLEIIGEAAARLSNTFQKEHPDLDIRNMKGVRNVLIHGYANVDLDVVWDITQRDIPILQAQLALLAPEQSPAAEEKEKPES